MKLDLGNSNILPCTESLSIEQGACLANTNNTAAERAMRSQIQRMHPDRVGIWQKITVLHESVGKKCRHILAYGMTQIYWYTL